MHPGFLRKHAQLLQLIFRLGDLLAIAAAGLLAYLLRFENLAVDGPYRLALIAVVTFSALLLPAFGLYQPWRGVQFREELHRVALAWLSIGATYSVFAYLTKTGALFSRLWFGLWVLIGLVLLVTIRIVIRNTLRWLRAHGRNTRTVAIAGAGALGQEVARQIEQASWAGLRVAAFFDDNPDLQDKAVGGIPVRGTLDDLAMRSSAAGGINQSTTTESGSRPAYDQVWIALPLAAAERTKKLCRELRDSTVDIHFVPDLFGLELFNRSVDDIAGIPVVNLSASPMIGAGQLLKGIEDKMLASMVLMLTSPLLLAIAVAVKITSRGPVLFKQRRYGLDGREIVIWKFRTMTVREDGPDVLQATRHDPRVTPLGAILRRTSLDELPQFFNVLQGRMSIVGPRPHAVAHNEQYRSLVDGYMLRHKVKPGITGWAQVNGWRGETDTVDKMQRRVEHDFHYITHWSLWLDLKIIALTLSRGFVSKTAY